MKAAGPSVSQNLDTRLLRFRNHPDSEPADALGRDLLATGRAAEALEVVRTALSAKPDDGSLLLVEGRAWLSDGDLIRAQAALLKAARSSPKEKQAFRWLGEVLLKRGDPDRAAKVLERATALDPHDREIQQLRSRAQRLARIATDAGDEHEEAPTIVGARALPEAERFEDATTTVDDIDEDEDVPTAVVQVDAQGNIIDPSTKKVKGRMPVSFDEGPEPPTHAGKKRPRVKKMTAMGMGPATSVPMEDEPFGPDPFADAPTNTVPRGPKPIAPPPNFAPPAQARPAPAPAPAPAPRPPAPVAAPRPYEPPPAHAAPEPAPYEPPPVAPLDDFDIAPSDAMPSFDGPSPQAVSDLEAGATYGQPEDVDQILRMLEREGIFEVPSGQAGQWATRKEAKKGRAGTRIGVWLGAVWVLAVGLAVGGYFGWQWWVEQRHMEAAQLVEQAAEAALAGDHEDLVAAERHLVQARELNPHDDEGPAVLLFVHAQRALEDGTFEPGYLRPSIRRAETHEVAEGKLLAATAVLAAGEGDMEAAQEAVEGALAADGDDAVVLYMVGRVEQRLGAETALEHLQAAVENEPAMVAAAMALAEARADDGLDSEAIELVDAVLANDGSHMRASLWKGFLTANDTEPDEGIADLDRQTAEIDDLGAATDRVLAGLTRARLLRRKGETEAATAAVDAAAQGGATDPRLLALVAREALSVGLTTRAQSAATDAVRGAPTNTEFRKLLAEIFISRRDGLRALRTLSALTADDPEVLRMSAKGALLVGGADALAAASQALGGFLEAHPDEENLEMRALLIRISVSQGQANDVLPIARELARDAPGDPNAALALGEAALSARQPRVAVEALESLVTASPNDAEGHYLLGRALRMSNDAEEAESSLRRSLELLPSHTDAQLALGRLLLDLGRYEDADTLYQGLAQQGGMAAGLSTALRGRLGRIESLVGLGRLDDATVQFENLRSEDRERAVARAPAALLALAKRQAGDAVSTMRPLAERESPRASDLALFGDALLLANQTEAAAAAYDQALELDPGLPEAILGRAKLAIRAESSRDAFAVLERMEEALSNRVRPPGMRAHMLTLEGRAHLLSGRDGKAEAREVLRRAVELPGVPPEAYFFLGEALAGENAPEATEQYQRYLELDENGPFARRARRATRD